MGENSEDNDPFEEDIVFDQTDLLGRKSSNPRHHQPPSASLPTFMLFIRVVFLCVIFLGLGLCAAVSQSPLINLEVAFGVPASQAFHIFTANSLGMLIGGVLGASLFDVFNRQFLIFISLVWVSICVIILPFTISISYWWTLFTIGALGSGLAFLFTGSNVLVLDLLGKHRGPGLQSLHFCFAVGALIAAVSIRPFLTGISNLGLDSMNTSQSNPMTSIELQRFPRHFNPNQELMEDFNSSHAKSHLDLSIPATYQQNATSSVNLTSIAHKVHSNATAELPPTPKLPTTLKVPKPKPSLTNGNLIPEPSIWKRPQKESPDTSPDGVINEKRNKTIEVLKNTSNSTNTVGNVTAIYNPSTINDLTTTAPMQIPDEQITPTIAENFDENATVTTTVNAMEPFTEAGLPNDKSDSTLKASSITEAYIRSTNSSINSTNATFTRTPTTTPIAKTTVATVNPSLPVPVRVNFSNVQNPPKAYLKPRLSATPIPKKIQMDSNFKIDYSNHSDYYHSVNTASEYPDYENPISYPKSTIYHSDEQPELQKLKEHVDDSKTGTPQLPTSEMTGTVTSTPEHQMKPGTFSNFSESNPHFLDTLAAKFKTYGITGIHLFYIGIGVTIFILSLVSVMFLCHKPREPRSKQEEGCLGHLQKSRLRVFIFSFSLYMFSAEALQGAIHHLLAASHTRVGYHLFTESVDGQAIFWGLVCVVRFLCIILSGCFRAKPGKLLVCSTFLMVLGSILLCIGTFDKKDFLWGGITIVSIGLAPVLPTCLLWMAEYMRVSHRMCALMIILCSFGNTLTHTSLTFVLANSHLYSYILIGISSSSVVFLVITFCSLLKNDTRKGLSAPEGYHLANQEDEEGLELVRAPQVRDYEHLSHRLNEFGEARQSLLID